MLSKIEEIQLRFDCLSSRLSGLLAEVVLNYLVTGEKPELYLYPAKVQILFYEIKEIIGEEFEWSLKNKPESK